MSAAVGLRCITRLALTISMPAAVRVDAQVDAAAARLARPGAGNGTARRRESEACRFLTELAACHFHGSLQLSAVS